MLMLEALRGPPFDFQVSEHALELYTNRCSRLVEESYVNASRLLFQRML